MLGPLRIVRGDEAAEIGSGRQRAVLAHLLAGRGRVARADELIEAVWGDDLPANPENTLQHAIAQLRKLMEPGRPRGVPPTVLVSYGDGYRLELEDHELDALEFSSAVDEASGLLSQGAARRALEVVERALGLWRGSAYAGISGDVIERERDRLDEVRIAGRVIVAEAQSALHGPESAVPVLESLTSEFPLRESLWAKLMEVLYRSGRQAEALRVYSEVSDVLGEELGLIPSRELRELEELILLQDPSLDDRERNISVPIPAQPLIGRATEVAELHQMLSTSRMVTVLGPGGAGKTRLAIELAGMLGANHPDGVWFVRLDELEDDALLAAKVGTVMGMPEDPDRDVVDTLSRFIGARSAALVLDNCEHLVEAVAALVATLLARCPNLTVLATSQQALDVRAERRFPVPPLALPGQGDASPFEDIEAVDAVRLFIDRARAVDPNLDLSDEGLRAIANIVGALDGMPLAIELAAARSDLFTPVELAMRLADRFGLLTDGPRDAPVRQRGLRAVFEWSFSLLDDNGQRCLSELSVFVGTFGPEAAAIVLEKPVETAHRILGHFAERSLLERDRSGGVTRFRMLESLRQFAAELLATRGGEEPTRSRHAGYYVDRVSVLDQELTAPGQERAFAEMVAESENIRSALAWTLRSGRLDLGVPLAARCGRFWDWRGSVAEASTWYRRLAEAEPTDDVPELGLALSWYGFFVLEIGDIERARDINRLARTTAAGSDDAMSAAAAATVGAVIARHDGELETALACGAEARARSEELEDRWLQAWSDNHDALCLLATGDSEAASEAAHSSLSAFEEIGDQRAVGWSKTVIATVALRAGDVATAAASAAAAADVSREVGDGRNAAWALEIEAEAAEAVGDADRAASLRQEARELLIERGVPFSPWRR